MNGKPIDLFHLFGFAVRADPSWFLLALLVVWSLASGVFPATHPGLPAGTYLLMGVGGALGLFLSIVFHELWHSLVARRYGLPMRGITLFIFGGIAEMEDEPVDPKAESLMAAAGPAASVVLGAALILLSALALRLDWPVEAAIVLRYLGGLNLALAVFNLLPGFPLDGGRILRAALWAWRRDMRWATRRAAHVGAGFGVLLMLLGGARAFAGDLVGGLWWVVLGLFLRGVAVASYQRLVLEQSTAGRTIDELIDRQASAVPAGASVQRLVDEYVLKQHHRTFPVVDGGRLLGCVSVGRLREVPRERWAETPVSRLVEPCGPGNTVEPGLPLTKAAGALRDSGRDRLIVAEDSHLIGTVEAEDLFRYLALRLEVEEAASAGAAKPR